jgi:hypothetical protein
LLICQGIQADVRYSGVVFPCEMSVKPNNKSKGNYNRNCSVKKTLGRGISYPGPAYPIKGRKEDKVIPGMVKQKADRDGDQKNAI